MSHNIKTPEKWRFLYYSGEWAYLHFYISIYLGGIRGIIFSKNSGKKQGNKKKNKSANKGADKNRFFGGILKCILFDL